MTLPSFPPRWSAQVLAALLLLCATQGCGGARNTHRVGWEPLRPGLDFAEVTLPGDPTQESWRIQVLRVDPRLFEVRLLSASAYPGRRGRTVPEWASQTGALAAINASMYMTDGVTSVALMRSGGHVNNPSLGRGMVVLLADPVDSTMPGARMVEMDDPAFEALLPRFRTAVQDLRIIASRPRPHVVWKGSPQKWSQAALGEDDQGRILLVFSRAPHNPSDLGRGLLELPLGIRVLAHAEGSDEASLTIRVSSLRKTWSGGQSSEVDADQEAQAVPNVIAVFPRK